MLVRIDVERSRNPGNFEARVYHVQTALLRAWEQFLQTQMHLLGTASVPTEEILPSLP